MRWPRAIWRSDLVIAVLVTVIAQLELLVAVSPVEGVPGLFLTNLLLLPALALRRSHPVVAVGVAAVGFALDPLVGDAPVATPFLVLLALMVSLGWHAATRAGVIGVAIMLVVGLTPQLVAGDRAADLVVNGALVVATWGAGHLLRLASDRRVQAELEADRAARRAILGERQRIARDLHDSMAHALTLITLQSGTARERATDPDAQELLGGIERTGREALADMHRLLRLVSRDDAAREDETVGVAALPDLVDASRGHLQVDLTVDLPEEVTGTLSTTIYRVVQEGLTNVVRHSDATHANVGVTRSADGLRVQITDDGRPRPSTLAGTGRGLTGLRERVDLVGGSVESGPTGHGWRLEARLPWETP